MSSMLHSDWENLLRNQIRISPLSPPAQESQGLCWCHKIPARGRKREKPVIHSYPLCPCLLVPPSAARQTGCRWTFVCLVVRFLAVCCSWSKLVLVFGTIKMFPPVQMLCGVKESNFMLCLSPKAHSLPLFCWLQNCNTCSVSYYFPGVVKISYRFERI